jgi:hypothetical protein
MTDFQTEQEKVKKYSYLVPACRLADFIMNEKAGRFILQNFFLQKRKTN